MSVAPVQQQDRFPPTSDAAAGAASRRLMFVVNVDWFFVSHRLPIAIEAMQAGYDVHVATALTDQAAKLQALGIRVHPLRFSRSGSGIFELFRDFLDICRIFAKVRPGIVHLVTIKPVLLGGIAARCSRVPAVVAAISGLGYLFSSQKRVSRLKRAAIGTLYRIALAHHNLCVIFQNGDDQKEIATLAKLALNKSHIIRGSGVDLNQYQVVAEPTGVPVVMLAARLLRDKGVCEFVQAARQIRAQLDGKARFVLVGPLDPDNPAGLPKSVLDDWVRSGSVEWWGQKADMPKVLAQANIVVLPSYREGLPKVLIEAAACARAVVTTDVPGCRDAISPGVSGLLVPVRDGTALAAAIMRLLSDADTRSAMGRAGRLLAERHFDMRGVVADHMDIYRRLEKGMP